MEPIHIEMAIYGADDYLWSYHIGNYYLWIWLPMDLTTYGDAYGLIKYGTITYMWSWLPMELLYMELLPMGILLKKLTTYWASTYTYSWTTCRSDYPMEITVYWGATCATDYLWYWLSMELITWVAFSTVSHDSGLFGSFAHFPSTICSLGIGKKLLPYLIL